MNHNLNRFLEAQEGCYKQVLKELRAGKKRTHWIWFIFPQMKGLGQSYNCEFYGISGLDEAREYLEHPILGKRLIECCEILLELGENNISKVMGYPDNVKLKSSMELFSKLRDYPFRGVLGY